MDTIGFFLFLHLSVTYSFKLVAADEKPTTSPRNEVCDMDSSCNSTTDLPIEIPTDKANVSEKWKYNVSDGITVNETTDVFHVSEINDTLLEIGLTPRIVNRSTLMNESKPINIKFHIHLEDECVCDVTKGGCDMNCCCDRDCLHVNRNVFRNCSEAESTTKDDFCPSKILNSPLLCIVKDNLYSRHFYPQHKMAPEPVNVDKLLKNRDVYGWSFPRLPPEMSIDYEYDEEFREYDFGSPIWIFTKSVPLIDKLKLPKATVASRDCSKTETVNFLENYEEICTHRIQSVSAAECEHPNSIFSPTRYFQAFSVIMNPSLINQSLILDCSYNCLNVTPLTCDTDDTSTCKLMNVSAMPSFLKPNVCQRAVTQVHYNLLHNGTEGILAAQVYFQQEDVVLKPNLLWAMTFKLTHQWFNQTQTYELSGYPGYFFGKPIITGFKVAKNRKENRTQYAMQINHQRKRWLTFFKTHSDGECMKTQRENVLFDENVYAHCFIRVPKIRNIEQCETFQTEIMNVIFGPYVNVSNAYVSTFGNPRVNDSSKWVPFVVDFPTNLLNESCSGLVSAVKIILLHAMVGDHNDPQQSIVALKVTGSSFDRSVLRYDKLKISFAVNFYDVTNPPLRIFAEPPTYEVKLPTDFFYPFFSTGPVNGSSNLLLAFLFGAFLYTNYV